MANVSFSALTDHLVEEPQSLLQLRAGAPPVLVVNKSPRELSGDLLTNRELEALTKVLLAGSQETPQEQGDGMVSGVFMHPERGRFDYRIRTREDARAIALRYAGTGDKGADSPAPTSQAETQRIRKVEEMDTSSIIHLLRDVVRLRASDLIVTSEGESSVRHGTDLVPIPGTSFTEEEILASLGDLLTEENQSTLTDSGSLDVALELPGLLEGGKPQRFRVNVFHHIRGLAAAYRPIWETIPSFEELNLPEVMKDLADFPYGLVLLTGPTGAGKSTTLCSLLEMVNKRKHCHIITLEDPIEFVFSRQKALVHQREVGVHVSDFALGLRAALRENPDVILVGEMRDKETISAAITAAETGHLVLSTLHCGNAAQAMDRIIDIFPEHQQSQVRVQLADCLRAVVTQKLLPVLGSNDRIPAVEILRVNTAVANMIRERKSHMLTSQMQTSKEEGMLPFDDSVVALYKANKISAETAVRVASEPGTIKGKLGLE